MPKWTGAVIGAAEIAGGAIMAATGVGAAVAPFLISAGVGTVLSGIGTMMQKGPLPGVSGSGRNPIAPWNVVYGRARVGGAMVYINSFGDNDKYIDFVIVLACHPCANVDQLLVDGNYVPIDPVTRCSYTRPTNGVSFYYGDSHGTGNTEFKRQAGIVTVTLGQPVTSLLGAASYDKVTIDHMPSAPDAQTLQGTFPILISATNPNQFTYICSGNDADVVNAGHITPIFADYKSKIYMENLLGTQTLGQTFNGMLYGTPYDGNTSQLVTPTDSNGNAIPNPWTANHSCVGHTVTFIRLHYNDQIWANGIPQFSFIVRGKQDIYDPRTGTNGYTENSALCIADHLANKTWGYKLNYHTDIPDTPLTAAANICDEAVNLAAGGTEPRYSCNGTFPLTMDRKEILQNLLTSCGGRRTDAGGQHVIWPAAWQGIVSTPLNFVTVAAGKPQWKPSVTMTDLYNGVKGTYCSPVNNWQSSDFPAYWQSPERGFSSDNYLAQDNGDRRWLDIQLPFTISASMAQRLAKIELLRRRYQGVATLPMNMAGYQMAPLDVWQVNFPFLGWTNKQFEVLDVRLQTKKQGEAMLLGTEVDVQETDSSIYDWATTEEETPQGYKQAVLPSTLNLSGPTAVGLESDTSTALVQSNGIVKARILVTWTDPADGYFVNGGHIETQLQIVQSSGSGPWYSVPSVLPGVQQLYIDSVIMGAQYNVQVRAVNAAGVPSDWVAAGPVTVTAQTASPYGPNGGTTFPPYGDPIYPQGVFYLATKSQSKADGSILAGIQVSPVVPVSVFSGLISAPVLNPAITPTSGGTIPGGQTVFLSFAAIDGNGAYTALSNIVPVAIPAGSNFSLPVSVTNYVAGMHQFVIYVGLNPNILYSIATVTAAASITVASILTNTGVCIGMPDARFDHFVLGTTGVLLAGSIGGTAAGLLTVSSRTVLSGSSIKLGVSGATLTPSSLVGRVLSILTFTNAASVPPENYAITANDASSITVSISTPPGGWLGGAGNGLSYNCIGELVCVRLQPTISTDGVTVTDSLLSMTANQYQGAVLRVFYADGSNQSSFIASNTANSFSVQASNNFTGSNPVYFWVEAGSFSAMVPTTPSQMVTYQSGGVPLFAPIDNISGFYAVQLFASDQFGNLSDAGSSPMRSFYYAGQAGSGSSGLIYPAHS